MTAYHIIRWRSASLNILEEKFHGNHLSRSLQSEEAARVHALKVVEVLKNEIKVNEDIFFDAVDHSMQNEESRSMKNEIWTKVVKPGVGAASYKCTKSRGTDMKKKKLVSHTITSHETIWTASLWM